MGAGAREADPVRGLAVAGRASAGQASAAPGRPHPAVAAVRLAVRRGLASLPDGSLALVACSGGADSLALAAALAFEAPRLGLRAGAVTVDHGLQEGSAARAERVAGELRGMGLDPVLAVAANVVARGPAEGSVPSGSGPSGSGLSGSGPSGSRVSPGDRAPGDRAPGDRAPGDTVSPQASTAGGSGTYRGPEAAAREARYAVLDATAAACGAVAIVLGHTMDDQAETVLLGLARGSGARSIAGMAPAAGLYLRPLLGLRRAQTRAACAALGLRPWDDPHNADHAYARTRVRERILPLMEELIGPGITEALARTADQLRADADVLDELAASHADLLTWDGAVLIGGGTVSPGALSPGALSHGDTSDPDGPDPDGPGLDGTGPPAIDVAALAGLPPAIRTRLLRRAAVAAGAPAGSLTARHVAELDMLVTRWHGQRWIDLPGGVRCQRRQGMLCFSVMT